MDNTVNASLRYVKLNGRNILEIKIKVISCVKISKLHNITIKIKYRK